MSDTVWWIRDAESNDAPELAVLMCELGYQTDRTEMETRLKLILSNPAYKTFVAIMDGSVCGTSRNWPFVDCNGGEKFRSKRNQARFLGYTAYSRRYPQVLSVARLRAKRVAICEATSGEQLIGTRCGDVGAYLRPRQFQ